MSPVPVIVHQHLYINTTKTITEMRYFIFVVALIPNFRCDDKGSIAWRFLVQIDSKFLKST